MGLVMCRESLALLLSPVVTHVAVDDDEVVISM